MRKPIIAFILCIITIAVQCQKKEDNCYEQFVLKAEAYTKSGNYEAALEELKAAKNCSLTLIEENELEGIIDETYWVYIKTLKNSLQTERKQVTQLLETIAVEEQRAISASKNTSHAQQAQQGAQSKIKALEAHNQRFMDFLYFYDNRLAIVRAGEGGSFGFIDTKGHLVIDYRYEHRPKYHSEIHCFEVSRNGKIRMMNMEGIEFIYANSLETLTNETTFLDLSSKELSIFPLEIINHPQLEILLLNNNELQSKDFPTYLNQLSNLKQLDLTRNELTSLPESISQLRGLERLSLSFNELESLPFSISQLQNLTHLDLFFNQLSSVPPSIGKLGKLRVLSLMENQLTYLPPSIGNLQRLEELSVGLNNLTHLPESIGKLTRLKKLYLGKNALSELPTLAQLNQLCELALNNNPIQLRCTQLSNLKKLEILNLANTETPQEEIAKLRESFPYCSIHLEE